MVTQPDTSETLVARRTDESETNRPIPQAIKHLVYVRDDGRCQFHQSGHGKCKEARWIDFHHKIPVSEGGLHTVENLVILCSSHHKYVHDIGQPGRLWH